MYETRQKNVCRLELQLQKPVSLRGCCLYSMSRRYSMYATRQKTVSRLELHCYKNPFSALLCLYSMSRRVSRVSQIAAGFCEL